jgi:PAS domain-containing protein
MFLAGALVVGGVIAAAVAARVLVVDSRVRGGLAVDEIERLRRAELALAAAPSIEAAAHELGKHAMALLDAPAAAVIIEGVGDTVRMEAGDSRGHSIYEPGSRMRLLADDGTPCGSIAVAARPGRPYTERDEHILDALGERVSSTLHRLSLFEAVRSEQRTLADVLGSSSDGIFSVGPDHRVRSWNPAMAKITGVATVVAVGQHCCALFRPRDDKGTPLYGVTCPIRSGDEVELLVQIDVTDRTVWLLRTPLTPIKGFLQTLTRRDTEFSQDERMHIYEVMLREEGRLERLVHQLLLATSLDAAESFVVTGHLDWDVAVRAHVADVQHGDATHEYSVAVAPDLPKVMADEQLAGQVLGNLLSNAAKYSPAGTTIGIGVAHDGHRVVTTVVDRGPGVPVADRERIFDRFTRLGDHLTRAQQGVGLGLYIVRRSVEAMGGTVWVDEAPGGGAAFSFSLPTVPARAKRPIRSR